MTLGGITLLGLLLRAHDSTAAPFFLDNADELQFAWAGMGLFLHGDPYTWSVIFPYPSYTTLHVFGKTFYMVHHWVDHPPLYSLLVGGWVVLLGDRHLDQVTAAQVRVIPILASSATIPLTAIFARPILGRWPALIAAALLATAPGAVLLGRESEPESVQAVLLLLALIACWRITHGTPHRVPWLIVACACALLAPGMKISGLAVGGILGVILLAERQFRPFWWVVGATIAGMLIWPLYGALVDWHLFVQHISYWNQIRQIRQNVLTIFDFIAAPSGVNRSLYDGWWLLGWIGLGVLAVVGGRHRGWFLVWPPVAYALVMLVLVGSSQTAQYGWYRVIIYPQVYLGVAGLAWWALRRWSVSAYALVVGLGGATATNWLFAGAGSGWAPSAALVVPLLVILLAPAVFAAWSPAWRRRAQWMMVAGLVVMLLANLGESLMLGNLYMRM